MFGKKRNKIDSKIRFQNPRFKKNLQSARGYKRPTRSIPQTGFGIFLSKIGLDNWATKILTFLILTFLVYIVYIPNFLFVKNVTLSGLSEENSSLVKNSINAFLEKRLPIPEKNILLLSKEKLTNYILENNDSVLKVTKIQKKFPSTLIIDTEQRVETFKLQSKLLNYLVSNDGKITRQISASTSLQSLPILITINQTSTLIVGQELFNEKTATDLIELNSELPKKIKSEITNFELPSPDSSDLTIHTTKGFKVLLDLTLDINKTLSRLSLLFNQFTDYEISRLFYVDMRFEGRGYVCYKETSCVQEINLPTNNTTTPENLPN